MAITFRDAPAKRALGRRANAEEWSGISRTLEGTTPLKFGVPAIAGTGDRGCLPLSAASQTILGITEADQTLTHPGDEYRQYDSVAICEVGVIQCEIGDAVVKNAQARFNVTSGKWTDAAASSTVLTVPGATFDETGTADGQIVNIRYRRPNPSLSAGA